jgi:hypothetical protein
LNDIARWFYTVRQTVLPVNSATMAWRAFMDKDIPRTIGLALQADVRASPENLRVFLKKKGKSGHARKQEQDKILDELGRVVWRATVGGRSKKLGDSASSQPPATSFRLPGPRQAASHSHPSRPSSHASLFSRPAPRQRPEQQQRPQRPEQRAQRPQWLAGVPPSQAARRPPCRRLATKQRAQRAQVRLAGLLVPHAVCFCRPALAQRAAIARLGAP